jgi:hypothetical protein
MNKLFLSAAIFISSLSFAQKAVEVKLNLRDGTTISGTTIMNDVVLKTTYGQLSIPIQNVNTIVVGIGKDKLVSDKAAAYLKILNSNATEEIKKGAYTDLVKLGVKAISAISDFQADPKNSLEVELVGEYTIDGALSELKNNFSIDDVSKINDVVTIDGEYTMGGAYDFAKMEVKTEYGNLSIPKEKIKTMDISYSEPSNGNEVVLKLQASKHISGNQNGGWLKTGINLKQGQKFSIMATGEVTLASLSSQKYKPDGSYTATNGTNYPATSSTDEYSSSAVAYPVYGNVVYKVGETSYDVLRAGAKFNGTAKTSGMLLIAIYETVYSAANTGSYTVKISLK